MQLSVGDKLGPYEILAIASQGGMGEVYRARFSPESRCGDQRFSNTQFSERFTQEARAIAALNHTNICRLCDVWQDYLVIEFVEGSNLRGPLLFKAPRIPFSLA